MVHYKAPGKVLRLPEEAQAVAGAARRSSELLQRGRGDHPEDQSAHGGRA